MPPPPRKKSQPGDPVWFRLLVRALPHDVVFPSITWRLLEPELASGRPEHYELAAVSIPRGHTCIVSEWFKQRDWLFEALYETGFAVRHQRLSETILRRMVRLGHAEELAAPLVPPTHGRGWPWNWR